MNVKTVLSHLTGRQVETFYALLVSSGQYTFLPELYDIFGREITIKFLDVFAGCKIRVPKFEVLEELARNTAIYVRIENVPNKKRSIIVKSIADEYELTEDRVRSLYTATKSKLEDELGFRVRRVTRVQG